MNISSGKKIAFVMPWHISERGGGAEVQANYLAMEFVNRGYNVFYICQTNKLSKINSSDKIAGVTIYWLKPSGRFPWFDQSKYNKPLNIIKPKIVIQRMSSNVNYIIGKYCKNNHAIYSWICTGNLNPFSNFHVKKFKERFNLKNTAFLKNTIFLMNAKIMDYYRNIGMKYISYGFSQNQFQKENIKASFGLQTHKMITGHPMPKKEINAQDRFKFQDVLWCANFGKHKRPELFIELARCMQHTNLNFVMVGGHSDKDYMGAVLKNKPSNLVSIGQVSFNESLEYFDRATLFINTSTPGGDGFPNTFVQAWLRKIPIITFGFDPDAVIKQNELGFNVESLREGVEKLTWILSDYSAYKVVSDNAYTYGRQNHSIKIMTDNFLKIIEGEGITLS